MSSEPTGALSQADASTIAWIFLAIGPDGGRLPGIIAAADAINHAVPMESELQLAFRHLARHGLVVRRGRRFVTTDAGRAMLERAHRGARFVMESWRELEAEIHRLDARSPGPAPAGTDAT